MCQEHYQEWKDCKCRGFLEIKICPELFKTCLGPSGNDNHKKVVLIHAGLCDGCRFRALQEAREAAQAQADAEGLSLASASASSPSIQPSLSRSTSYSNTSYSNTLYSSAYSSAGFSDSTAGQ